MAIVHTTPVLIKAVRLQILNLNSTRFHSGRNKKYNWVINSKRYTGTSQLIQTWDGLQMKGEVVSPEM